MTKLTKSEQKIIEDIFAFYSESRLSADYKEYLWRKYNRFPNNQLYLGLAFKNKREIDVYKKYKNLPDVSLKKYPRTCKGNIRKVLTLLNPEVPFR